MFLSGLLGHGPLDAAEVFANGPHGTDVAIEHGWVHEQLLPDGRWRLAPSELVARLEGRAGTARRAGRNAPARQPPRGGMEQLDHLRRARATSRRCGSIPPTPRPEA